MGEMSSPVLVIDDHRAFADLMRIGLDGQEDLHCAAVAHSLREALSVSAAVPYSGAIVDLGLPDGDGAQAVRALRERAPDARIVVLTAHPRSDIARRARRVGADAVLPKTGRFAEVLQALRERSAASAPAPEENPLTARETQVIALLAEGDDVQRIAETLSLSSYTVRDHVKAILAKLGARSQLEAVVIAARSGIVLMEPR